MIFIRGAYLIVVGAMFMVISLLINDPPVIIYGFVIFGIGLSLLILCFVRMWRMNRKERP